jgi:hypothetical protein
MLGGLQLPEGAAAMSRLHRLDPVRSLTDATFASSNDKLGLASGRSPGARTTKMAEFLNHYAEISRCSGHS